MPYNEILKLPWIIFVLGMLDAPQIDYDKEKKNEGKVIPKTAEEEAKAFINFFN